MKVYCEEYMDPRNCPNWQKKCIDCQHNTRKEKKKIVEDN